MAFDRIMQLGNAPGTGDVTFTGTEVGFRAYSPTFTAGAGDDIDYYIEQYDPLTLLLTGKWETGVGRLLTASTFQRLAVTASSAGVGTAENFTGNIRVGHGVTDGAIRRIINALKGIASGLVPFEADLGVNLPVVVGPTSPPANFVKLFARNLAGRIMLAIVGPSGLDVTLQPHIGRNKVGLWSALGNTAAAPIAAVGIGAPTVTGTATQRDVATTSLLASTRRIGYVGAATAASVVSIRLALAQFFRGTGLLTGGGFNFTMRFAVSDAALVATARCFFGFRDRTLVQGDADPSTFLNTLGVGQDAGDTNWFIMYNDGAGVAVRVNTGIAIDATSLLELVLFTPPGGTSVTIMFTNITTGVTFSTTTSTDIPAQTQLLTTNSFRSNGAAGVAAVAFDFVSAYFETDS